MTRIERFAKEIAAAGLDAGLVTNLINIRYLTGFTGSNAVLLVSSSADVTLATDGRYHKQIVDQTGEQAIISAETLDAMAEHLKGTVGFEAGNLSVQAFRRLDELTTANLVPMETFVERLREVKDEGEIAHIEQACEISVAALRGLLTGPFVGRTEREIARDLEWRMFELGAEALAFETICAAGENSAIPHHRPTDRVIAKGDLLKIDFGARLAGYHADFTRTFVIGPPADWQKEIHQAVKDAQAAGVAALEFGAEFRSSRIAVDDSLGAWGEHFKTGLGHGVGLEIHEDPHLRLTNTGTVVPRITLTVEPGIYLGDRGGVRIEDTLLTTDSSPRVLTEFERDLLEL